MLAAFIGRINQAILEYLGRRQVMSRVSCLLKQSSFARQQLLRALDRIEKRSGAKESLQESVSRKAA